jgi:Ser-tRNA(Ala) deacylase AlaX
MACELLYLKDLSLLSCEAEISAVDADARKVLLTRTSFYPQGGGQQSDQGTLSLEDGRMFKVTAVKKDAEGNPWHFVDGEVSGELVGKAISCQVDAEGRSRNSRSHSAGHVLDHAAEDLELPLEVRGAFHFLPSPYVEYEFVPCDTMVPKEKLPELAKKMEDTANAIIAASIPVRIYEGSVEELTEWRRFLLPPAVLEGGRCRLIKFEGPRYLPVPCSGTHVSNTADVLPIKVKKISQPYKDKPQFIRVVYTLQ